MQKSSGTFHFLFHSLLRWILEILHDPKYPKPWKLRENDILRACRMLSINSKKVKTEKTMSIGSSVLVQLLFCVLQICSVHVINPKP